MNLDKEDLSLILYCLIRYRAMKAAHFEDERVDGPMYYCINKLIGKLEAELK